MRKKETKFWAFNADLNLEEKEKKDEERRRGLCSLSQSHSRFAHALQKPRSKMKKGQKMRGLISRNLIFLQLAAELDPLFFTFSLCSRATLYFFGSFFFFFCKV